MINDTHSQLFTSGSYVQHFRPDSPTNPFAGVYARKREAVIASVSGSDQRVLDLAGGMGRMAVPLSQRHFVTLCDLSPQMLELARPFAGPRLKLHAADAHALPFGQHSFDWVVCIDLLSHVRRPGAVLDEIRRVLAPGGHLVIDSTNAVPIWTLAYPRYLGRNPTRWVRIWRGGGVDPAWHGRVWHRRRSTFKNLLSDAGFQVTDFRALGPRHWPQFHLATAVAVSP